MFLHLFFLTGTEKEARAAQPPFDGEGMAFDEEGNFWMVSHDRAATSGTRYSTLGWTIKRYNSPIAGNESVRVKLESYGASQTDPENPGYVYVYFVIHKDVIYHAIAAAYPQWAQTLYTNGGMVYLDGIMTVSENGVKKGAMGADGTLSGEVYTDYAGIANARNWRDKEALKSHFNKSVYFPANPQMLETEEKKDPSVEEQSGTETITVTSTPDEAGLSGVNTLVISSEEFDADKAIPSGEAVTLSGSFHKYYYTAVYERCYGTKAVPVTAQVTYTLVWNDGTPHSEQVTVTRQTEVARAYSYWKVKSVDLHYIKSINVENGALPDGKVTLEGAYTPQVVLRQDTGGMTLPAQTVALDGGTVNGGTVKPAIPQSGVSTLADAEVGKITVKNDLFSVDGEVFLSADACTEKTEAPVTLSGTRMQPVSKSGVVIPQAVKNQTYGTTATAEYASYFSGGSTVSSGVSGVNAVSVHTPVVCAGAVSDDKAFNQQIAPTANKSLILGRDFTVSVGTAGAHMDAKGYGTRDYREYVGARQVCFPFPVTSGGRTVAAGQWITLNAEQVSFTLPVSVPEGDYEIAYRAVATNAGSSFSAQAAANLDRTNAAASGSVTVTVIGRLYGFAVTDIVDYPRWQSVFWDTSGLTRTGTAYYSGTNDCNGKKQREADSLFLVPLLKGSHPQNSEIHAPGLGYRAAFEVKTVGSMAQDDAAVWLRPAYYYVNRSGKKMQRVKLYNKEDLSEFYLPVTLTKADRTVTAEGMQTWSGSYRLPPDVYAVNADTDFAAYVEKKGGRVKQRDEVFLRDGYIVVYFSIQTVQGGIPQLDYENRANIHNGYCDMWKTEGYQTSRVDSCGVTFTFAEGMVLLFDQSHNLSEDYESVGTH